MYIKWNRSTFQLNSDTYYRQAPLWPSRYNIKTNEKIIIPLLILTHQINKKRIDNDRVLLNVV